LDVLSKQNKILELEPRVLSNKKKIKVKIGGSLNIVTQ
jgi:hypothetical protein